VVVGSVDGITSDDPTYGAGGVTVTAVPRWRAPANFTDNGVGNADGINSLIFRGGTGGSGETDTENMNPAVRLTAVDYEPYRVPDGSGPDFETEAHVNAATLTGSGNITYVPGSNKRAAMAGTGLMAFSGGPQGLTGAISANSNYCVRIFIFPVCGDMSVDGITLPGWFTQAGGVQEIEQRYSAVMHYDDCDGSCDEHRNINLNILTSRGMP
jgi:hypothetical protein